MKHTLTEQQWRMLEPLLPQQNFQKGGRPRADDRKTVEGILWILRTGAQWGELPPPYGSPSTCWRRLRDWEADGTWERIWRTLLAHLHKKERIDWAMAFLDGSFVPAQKGGSK